MLRWLDADDFHIAERSKLLSRRCQQKLALRPASASMNKFGSQIAAYILWAKVPVKPRTNLSCKSQVVVPAS